MSKQAAILTAAILLFLGTTARADAANYYVSPTGSASWSMCTSVNTPCSALTAMANAQAGDTVYFRGGQYEVGQSATWGTWPWTFAWNPAHSGTPGNPITFMAYPGETPVVNGTVSGTAPGTWTGNNESTCVLGAVGRSYITWDGFTVQANNGAKMASVLVYGTSGLLPGITIRNFIFNGGRQLTNDGNNWEGLRVEKTTGLTVSNCLFYNYRNVTGNHNTSGYKGYGNSGGVLEKIEAYNCTVALFLKGTHNDFVVRNNFIHDSARGIYLTPQTVNMLSDRGHVYNNLIVNTTYAAFESDSDATALHGDDWEICNNTFYNNGLYGIALSGNTAGHGWKIYNNIVANETQQYLLGRVYTTLSDADHNQWGSGPLKWTMRLYQSNQTIYTSLAAWQASAELEGGAYPGVGDLASDPGFSNGSGTLTLLSDFVLAPASVSRGAGRNGIDMGAVNIAATVGYNATRRQSPAGPMVVVIKGP